MPNESDLPNKQFTPCDHGTQALLQEEITKLLNQLDGWRQHDKVIERTFEFKNHYQTIAFVNAVAWLSHRTDHHPDLKVGFNKCQVEYSTHAINGLSENDFICAAKVDVLFST